MPGAMFGGTPEKQVWPGTTPYAVGSVLLLRRGAGASPA
jgi:hypothetical protein